ncbi:hypothetical protein LTR10_004475 [Elasticomyces elasticus]|nr:hypothetical protein LTR10_004475 [Elasticomyces elasticus]KAK4976794.1 hypothetical protein LTR42_002839 [Elasticomyces elasticus]
MAEGRKTGKHLVHSHAHEDVPGTVNVQALEGDDTAYGQALYPVPADDPNDPLQWPDFTKWPGWKKDAVLIICCIYSFLCNSTLIGSSVYIGIYAVEFNVSPTVASQTSSYPTLAFGLGCWVLIPMYVKFGRRPTMLFSQLLYTFGTLGCSQATTFNGFMAARIILALGSGVCEALPVQCVNDVYFLHERGKRISYYTAALCLGAIGPLPAGYMLAAGYSFRLFFYVEFAFAVALLIATFFLVPETAYKRHVKVADASISSSSEPTTEKNGVLPENLEVEGAAIVMQRKSYVSQLKPWGPIDKDAEFFGMMWRGLTYLLVPQVLWVITSFGIYIGIAALAVNYTFPSIIAAPPYNWPVTGGGLIAIAYFIGYGLALPFSNSSDRLAARLTVRNNGIREAEMRLGVMLPAMLIGPAGLVVYGMTAQLHLHWVGYFAAVAMIDWSALFYFTFTLAYAVDSYYANVSEMLIAMNIAKNAISFGMGYSLLTWILEIGYKNVIAGAFTGVLLANNLFLLLFMWKGKSIRVAIAQSWLARLHRKTAAPSEVL